METTSQPQSSETELTHLIDLLISSVNLKHVDRSTLTRDTKLTGGDLDLDSVDVLEIIVALEHKYGIRIRTPEVGKEVFSTIGSLYDYISSQKTRV